MLRIEDLAELSEVLREVDLQPVRPVLSDLIGDLLAQGVNLVRPQDRAEPEAVAAAALLREDGTAWPRDRWPLVHLWTRNGTPTGPRGGHRTGHRRPRWAADRAPQPRRAGSDRAARGPATLDPAGHGRPRLDHRGPAGHQRAGVRRRLLLPGRDATDDPSARSGTVSRCCSTRTERRASRCAIPGVYAARRPRIAEAWQAEIEQAATARGDVAAQARLVQSIADLLPQAARQAFEQAMQVSPDWVWTDGEYRRAVAGGYTAYRPDSGELEIVIELREAIEAVGTATLVATGEVTGEVTAEATGTYYTDNWRGQSKEVATERAQSVADAKADELAEQHKEALKFQAAEAARHALNERTGKAAAQARLSAEQQLTEQAAEVQSDLDEQAGQRLEAVQTETLKGVFQLVATGYSAVMQAYALEHGENLEVSEEDGVIEIQFELEQ